MNIYAKPIDFKRYVYFLPNHRTPCQKSTPFFLARCNCMIAENKNAEYIKLKKLRKIVTTQEYPQMIIGKGIEKTPKIP